MSSLRDITDELFREEETLRQGGGADGQERQRRLGRLNARERLAALLDKDRPFFELGIWAAYEMYAEWGDVPAAGIVTGIGWVNGRPCLVAANDATVKAGAMFPQSVKKLLRAQRDCTSIPLAADLPRRLGRRVLAAAGRDISRRGRLRPDLSQQRVISAAGIPQYAAVMGNCIAGGAYLPVLCDKLLMTDGSQLCLAGPALVKAAIGQIADPEELGGASMHAAISGTVDFHEPNDEACLERIRSLVDLLPPPKNESGDAAIRFNESAANRIYDLVPADGRGEYEIRDVLASIVDEGSLQEYKAEFGQTLVTAFARIGGRPAGIVANQKHRCRTAGGELQIGGVIYADAADKAARFVMDCNQISRADHFSAGRSGFMVGKQAEQIGHHPCRRETGERRQQFDRAEADGCHRRLVRRRQLRVVRQGIRSGPYSGVAVCQVCRHGRRSGGRDDACSAASRREARGTKAVRS